MLLLCSTTLNLAEVVTGRVIGPQGVTGTRTTEWATAAAVSRITVYCLPVGKRTYLKWIWNTSVFWSKWRVPNRMLQSTQVVFAGLMGLCYFNFYFWELCVANELDSLSKVTRQSKWKQSLLSTDLFVWMKRFSTSFIGVRTMQPMIAIVRCTCSISFDVKMFFFL